MKMIAGILKDEGSELLSEWIKLQEEASGGQFSLSREELEEQSKEFLKLFTKSVTTGERDLDHDSWDDTLAMLRQVAIRRSQQGMQPAVTATFVLSLKEVLFASLVARGETKGLLKQLWDVTRCVDQLGLFVMEIFIERREDVIVRQQEELIEISTPVVELWDGILALPIIGTLDSARAQVVMEGLLQAIVDNEASIAIIDITGVPAVDTQTAQHLLKTVTAAELMGTECFVSGVRPQIAQTIVQLGLDFGGMRTKATLMSAFANSLSKLGLKIVKVD